ncbi:MAG: rod shape-determining protein MreC [Acidobacteriota bacterium]
MALSSARRARYLFVAVTVGHILLISTQVSTRSGASLLDSGVVAAFTGAQRAAWAVAGGVRSVWSGYAVLRSLKRENEALVRQVTELRVRLQEERASARGAAQLREALGLRSRLQWETIGSEVVAGSASLDFRSITINKGMADGVAIDMAVMAPAGVVGRVVRSATAASIVQLLVDRNAAAAVVVERSRAQGIVVGDGETLHLQYLSATADLRKGDSVVTAGMDGVYPPGLLVGQVDRVDRAGMTYRDVVVRPAVDFSRLEVVFVVPAGAPGQGAP